MSGEQQADGTLARKKRLALVVGVNHAPKSQLGPLVSACQDAEAVADVLEKYCNFVLLNDEPLLEEQATSAAIKDAVLDLLEQGKANDELLFYFSGHGQLIDVEAERNEVYLGTYDFVEKRAERDENRYLSLSWLRDKLFQQTQVEKCSWCLIAVTAGIYGIVDQIRTWRNFMRRSLTILGNQALPPVLPVVDFGKH